MVIIEVRTEQGVVGRCDANCYNAKEPECHCICGGANHGVGLKIAVEDRRYIPDSEILEVCKNLQPQVKFAVYKPQIKKTLFGDPEPADKKTLDIGSDNG